MLIQPPPDTTRLSSCQEPHRLRACTTSPASSSWVITLTGPQGLHVTWYSRPATHLPSTHRRSMLRPRGLQPTSSMAVQFWGGQVELGTSWHHDGLFLLDRLDLAGEITNRNTVIRINPLSFLFDLHLSRNRKVYLDIASSLVRFADLVLVSPHK